MHQSYLKNYITLWIILTLKRALEVVSKMYSGYRSSDEDFDASYDDFEVLYVLVLTMKASPRLKRLLIIFPIVGVS